MLAQVNGILRKAVWIVNVECWKKKKRQKSKEYPCHKLVCGDFIEKYKGIGINWGMQSNTIGIA